MKIDLKIIKVPNTSSHEKIQKYPNEATSHWLHGNSIPKIGFATIYIWLGLD